MIKKSLNESGQTIAAIMLIMVVALGIGVTVSTRFIKSLSSTTRTDSSSRALAVAEAAVERLLVTPYSTLVEYIQFSSCGSECLLSITGSDGIVANAVVELSLVGETSEPFPIDLREDDVTEVFLQGYDDNTNVDVCWSDPETGDRPSVTGTLVRGTDGNYTASGFSYNSIGSLYSDNGFSTATAMLGYDNCLTVNSGSTPVIMRLRSLYNDVEANIIPASGVNLPTQGVQMVSTGTVGDVDRRVTVIKSDSFVPIPFDYTLFSKSTTEPLSN